MKRGYVDIPIGQMHYLVQGEGESLLLLHQTPLSSNEYSEIIPILGNSFRTMAIDTPGYGKSDPLPPPHTIPRYAQCVIDFLNALKVKKSNIIGIHTGASIAVEIAAAYPDRVDKIILVGCPVYDAETRESRIESLKSRRAEISEDGAHFMRLWQQRKCWDPNAKVETWHKAVVDYLLAGNHAEDGHEAVYRYYSQERLPLIKSPVLLIGVTDDILFDQLESARSLIRNCTTQIIKGGGNLIGWERPSEFVEATLKFLKAV